MNATLKTPPPIVTVTLTENQRRNAVAFLRRVPLKGEEARALVEVMDVIAGGESRKAEG